MSFFNFNTVPANAPFQTVSNSLLTVSFTAAPVLTSIQLDWPFLSPGTLYPLSSQVYVVDSFISPSMGTLYLPNMTYASTALTILIYNGSSNEVSVGNFLSGDIIQNIAPNTGYLFTLVDNSTPDGIFNVIGLDGGVPSPVNYAGEGLTFLNDGTLNATTQVNLVTLAPHMQTYEELASLVVWNAGTGTYTLLEAGNFPSSAINGFSFTLLNVSGGIITVNASGEDSIVNASVFGLSSIDIGINQSCTFSLSLPLLGFGTWFTVLSTQVIFPIGTNRGGTGNASQISGTIPYGNIVPTNPLLSSDAPTASNMGLTSAVNGAAINLRWTYNPQSFMALNPISTDLDVLISDGLYAHGLKILYNIFDNLGSVLSNNYSIYSLLTNFSGYVPYISSTSATITELFISLITNENVSSQYVLNSVNFTNEIGETAFPLSNPPLTFPISQVSSVTVPTKIGFFIYYTDNNPTGIVNGYPIINSFSNKLFFTGPFLTSNLL